MKVIETLDVSAQQFYEYLLQQVRKDIEKATKKSHLTLEQLDGFTYSRILKRQKGDPLEIKIKVGPLIENRYYELSYETPTARNRYFYDIRQLEDHRIQVTYVEENGAKTALNNWVYKTRVKFKEKHVEQRIRQTLTQIEAYILNHEENA